MLQPNLDLGGLSFRLPANLPCSTEFVLALQESSACLQPCQFASQPSSLLLCMLCRA